MFTHSQMLTSISEHSLDELWLAITQNYCVDEASYLNELISFIDNTPNANNIIEKTAYNLVESVREQGDSVQMIDALLQEYSLDTKEGILLMCLAEALLRIPDAPTADTLIKDKISVADWQKHVSRSDSTLVNASTWGLILTGKVVSMDKRLDGSHQNILRRLIKKSGEPVIRNAMYQAMKIIGKQFVLGQSINDALNETKAYIKRGYTYSFDMLGEAAITADDAQRYYDDYQQAIEKLAAAQNNFNTVSPPTVSIKLSALHPRYKASQEQRVLNELAPRLLTLLCFAREKNVPITIDAEEMDRLELSLKLFKQLYQHPDLKNWGGFGLVVQAYSKRALPVLCWLNKLAEQQGDIIPVRLVKGAYWDNEIKHAQQLGLSNYPVYTRKEGTDTAYIACVNYLFNQAEGNIFPQFATHNAHTAATVLTLGKGKDFEFQRLHGMGDSLYDQIIEEHNVPVRIYAPIGAHKDLLPYLVRRLLENGANSSFVHRLVDAKTPIESLIQNPIETLKSHSSLANTAICLPSDIFAPERKNSSGINLFSEQEFHQLQTQLASWKNAQWQAAVVIDGAPQKNPENTHSVYSPQNKQQLVGEACWATADQATQVMQSAAVAFHQWNHTPVEVRANCLRRFAELLEEHSTELIALCCYEAGKTLQDSIDEIREAVDFCYYYAKEAEEKFGEAELMPGPTGESNELYLEGRGVFVCISPWNFPLAIYSGQIVAALVAGNTVIAKPAEETSLIAARAHELMLAAGFPKETIQFLPGDGASLGKVLLSAPELAGVCFTGSTQVARLINQQLAHRDGAIVPLIAETGGQNCMIVDSSALPEQVVNDVVHSSFASAGQRCSALRVLYVQEDIVELIKTLLKGAMAELQVGNPELLASDVGPVINAEAQTLLNKHITELKDAGQCIAQAALKEETSNGYFVAPSAFTINSINDLEQEFFGPILHIVSYRAEDLNKVIAEINQAGYGLTLGIQSRCKNTSSYIEREIKVGNCYINRNQIGAVVGVQPFGGRGLSGTGPKAGGPHYLLRFATERTRTINTTAVGGNASLLSLNEETINDE